MKESFARLARLKCAPYLLLLLLTVVFFWDSFFAHQALCLRDIFCGLPAWAHFFHRTLHTDEWIPLWNPFNGYGKPFIADPLSAFFYPPNWIFCWLRPGLAFTVYLALHVWVAGCGIYALCRHWKLAAGPALLAAISLMFSTWLVAMMEFRELLSTVVWGGLDLLLVSRFLERLYNSPQLTLRRLGPILWREFRWLAGFAFFLAWQYLAGYPQMLLYNLLLLAGFCVCRAMWLRRPALLWFSFAAMALAGLMALCLCLPQFLLSAEMIRYSERAHGIDPGLNVASMHPRHLITLLLPFVYGRPGYPHEYWGDSLFEFWIGTCYIGILPLIFATFSFAWMTKKTSPENELKRFLFFFFLAVAIFGLMMAAGRHAPFYTFFNLYIPGLSFFRWPSKFLLFLLYALVLLAALGYQALLEAAGKSKIIRLMQILWWLLFGLMMAAPYLFNPLGQFFNWLTQGRFISSPAHDHQVWRDYSNALIFLGLGLVLVFILVRFHGARKCGQIAVVVLTFVNLFIIGRQINFRTNDDIYDAKPDLIARGQLQAQPFELYSLYGTPQLYGSRDRAAFLSAQNGAVNNMLQPYQIFHVAQDWLKLERGMTLNAKLLGLTQPEQERLADLMNIRYFLSRGTYEEIHEGPVPLILRTNCLPRAYLVNSWETIPEPDKVLPRLLLPSFDFKNSAIIEPLQSQLPSPAVTAGNETRSEVPSIRYSWNKVELTAVAQDRSMLVLIDTWYPGWVARVDGRVQPIYRANFNFRGVLLEKGEHRVVFSYEPWQFRFGLRVSLFIAALMSFLLILRWRGKFPPPDLEDRTFCCR